MWHQTPILSSCHADAASGCQWLCHTGVNWCAVPAPIPAPPGSGTGGGPVWGGAQGWAQGAGGTQAQFPASLLAQVPAHAQRKACICARCVAAHPLP